MTKGNNQSVRDYRNHLKGFTTQDTYEAEIEAWGGEKALLRPLSALAQTHYNSELTKGSTTRVNESGKMDQGIELNLASLSRANLVKVAASLLHPDTREPVYNYKRVSEVDTLGDDISDEAIRELVDIIDKHNGLDELADEVRARMRDAEGN